MLERQTLLLFDSIRRYAGRLSDSSLYAFSPRAGHAIANETRRRLDEQGVTYVDKILNTECAEYGSANRVAAAAYMESTSAHELLVILDSDTIFLREPAELVLASDIEVAVRPVDIKGMSTSGPTDSCDRYWQDLCRCCGVDYDEIPWRESFVDHQRIKANYNGGLVVVRRSAGVLRRWSDFFFRSIRAGLKPHTNAETFRAGAGWIEPAAANLWGSNHAALSLAIWSRTRHVSELPATYNYPLHLHNRLDAESSREVFPELVHVHYHALFAPDALPANPMFLKESPLSAAQRDWLRASTPIA